MTWTNAQHIPDDHTLKAADAPHAGRIVRLIESGELLVAMICGVNENGTVNLVVWNHDATSFTRRDVGALKPTGADVRTDHPTLRQVCEQRWFWPRRDVAVRDIGRVG